jgi:hypothetical protein
VTPQPFLIILIYQYNIDAATLSAAINGCSAPANKQNHKEPEDIDKD